MTYLEYIDQLSGNLKTFTNHIVKVYKLLKGDKGYLTKRERVVYQSFVNEFIDIQIECEALIKMVRRKQLDVNSEVTPEIMKNKRFATS
jgi:hypothetical protein